MTPSRRKGSPSRRNSVSTRVYMPTGNSLLHADAAAARLRSRMRPQPGSGMDEMNQAEVSTALTERGRRFEPGGSWHRDRRQLRSCLERVQNQRWPGRFILVMPSGCCGLQNRGLSGRQCRAPVPRPPAFPRPALRPWRHSLLDFRERLDQLRLSPLWHTRKLDADRIPSVSPLGNAAETEGQPAHTEVDLDADQLSSGKPLVCADAAAAQAEIDDPAGMRGAVLHKAADGHPHPPQSEERHGGPRARP